MSDEPIILRPPCEKHAGLILTTLAKAVIALEMGGVERSSLHLFLDHALDQDRRAKAIVLLGGEHMIPELKPRSERG
jgi:hypothetical protein